MVVQQKEEIKVLKRRHSTADEAPPGFPKENTSSWCFATFVVMKSVNYLTRRIQEKGGVL